MDLIEIRRRLLMQDVPYIGGLPVLMNNAYLDTGDVKYNENFTVHNSYFVTGWFDNGDNTPKEYRMSPVKSRISFRNAYARWYNDKDMNAVDYWGANSETERVVSNTPGRFLIATVYKPTAGSFYIYDMTNNRYVIKGNNVT